MKRLWFVALLLCIPSYLHAAITDPQVIQEKSIAIHLSTAIAASNIGASGTNPTILCVVQLSSNDTTTGAWPHQETGEIDISHIRYDIDKVAASSGSVRIGVVTFINTSTGSVTFFSGRSYTRNISNTDTSQPINETSAFYRCKVLNATANNTGTTPYIASNEVRTGSVLYTSTMTFTASTVSINKQLTSLHVGDIVAEVLNQDPTNTVTVGIDLVYHSEK